MQEKMEVDNGYAADNEDFPSAALESGEESEPSKTGKRTAATIKLAAKRPSFPSEWRCSIWEVFNRTYKSLEDWL